MLSNMKVLQKTVDAMEREHICKPSLAMHNCFFNIENVAQSQFCGYEFIHKIHNLLAY